MIHTLPQRLGGCEYKAWLANVDPVLNKRWKQLMEHRQRAAQLAAARAAAEEADAEEAAAEAADAQAHADACEHASETDTRAATAAPQASSDTNIVQASPMHEPTPSPSQHAAPMQKQRRGRQVGGASVSPTPPSPPPVEDEAAYMQWLLSLQEQEQGMSAADVVKQRKRARTQILDPSMYNEPRVRKPQGPRQVKPKVRLEWATVVRSGHTVAWGRLSTRTYRQPNGPRRHHVRRLVLLRRARQRQQWPRG